MPSVLLPFPTHEGTLQKRNAETPRSLFSAAKLDGQNRPLESSNDAALFATSKMGKGLTGVSLRVKCSPVSKQSLKSGSYDTGKNQAPTLVVSLFEPRGERSLFTRLLRHAWTFRCTSFDWVFDHDLWPSRTPRVRPLACS